MITINKLVKYYCNHKALEIENLIIEEGKIYAFVGENGCGKSTLLRSIAGVYNYDGEILIDGVNPKINNKIKSNIFFISDNPIYQMSISELYELYKNFYNFDKDELYKLLDEFEVNKKGSLNKFSKGMRRRVYLAFALAIKPKYLLLDEAFDGVDIKGKTIFKENLFKIMEENNITVLISTHALNDVDLICDAYYLFKNGSLILYNDVNEDSNKYVKYQLAFNDNYEIAHDDIIKVIGNGKIKTVYAKNTQSLSDYIKSINPIVFEKMNLNMEEVVMYVDKDDSNE